MSSSGIVVLSGNPRPGSRTRALAETVGAAAADRLGLPAPSVVDVASLGPGLLDPAAPETAAAVAALRAAHVLVVATPTYKGSYTGVLKVLLDHLPAGGLAGVRAVPVVTAGVRPQADGALTLLVQLLRELGASVVKPGLAVAEPDLTPAAPAGRDFTETVASLAV